MAKTSTEILIGAKDNASSVLQNVSKNLGSTGNKAKEMGKSAQGAGSDMKGMGGSVGALGGGLGKLVPILAAVGVGFLAFKALKGILTEGVAAFAIQEKAVRDLDKTLESLGDTSQDIVPDLMAFASELQVLTNVGDEVTLGTMKRLRTLGFEANELKGATQAAIGLTAAFGSQEAAIEAVAKAHEGDFDALKEKIPALRTATTLAEKQKAVNDAAAAGFIVAAEGTTTMGGALTALGNAWGDTLESIGELVAPWITRIADMFNRIAPLIQEKIGLLLPIMEHMAKRAAEIGYWIFEQLVKAYTMVETVINNFGEVVTLVWNSLKLAVLLYVNQIIHNFTVALPMAGKWFVDNFGNIMTDLFSFMQTLVVNYVKMYVDNFMFLLNWIKSGFAGGASALFTQVGKTMGTNLLEGFQSTTEKMPNILARELTDAEKALGVKVMESGSKIGDSYNNAVKERLGFFGDVFDMDLGEGAKKFEGIGLTQGAKDREQEKLDKEKDKGNKDPAKLSADESRFLTRGTGDVAPEQQMVDEQKAATEVLKGLAGGMGEAVAVLGKIFTKESDGTVEIIQSMKGG